jgi:hypothetical protein
VLGGQLLVLHPEGVDAVNHLLDQLHLGVAQAVLVRDVVSDTFKKIGEKLSRHKNKVK